VRGIELFPVAVPKSMRGTARFSDFESQFLFPISANFPLQEFFQPAPNTRVHAHGADAIIFRSTSLHRSTAASLPNLHQAGQLDKHFLEN
jgi:hypothetical protein